MTSPVGEQRTTTCRGCGERSSSATYRVRRQPVISNSLFETAVAAMRVPRRDIVLTQCRHCGLVFNRPFDPDVISYAQGYENRQSCSPTFGAHMASLVADLTARHGLRGKRVLEIGCGQGDFLTLLCSTAGASGVGYDASYRGPRTRLGGKVRFEDRYVSAAEISGRFDLVVCRHVVEHIGEIGAFLAALRAIAERCGGAVTVIETPDFEWTARNACFWDVFYEHCNYLTRPCLAHLSRRTGLTVLRHRLVFGGQYQLLELRPGRRTPGSAPRRPVELGRFARDAESAVRSLERRLEQRRPGAGWAIWGAGAKGVTLATRLRSVAPSFVVDVNPAKQGCIVPATRVPIVAPDDPRVVELGLILVANPNYAAEIESTLRSLGYDGTVLAA